MLLSGDGFKTRSFYETEFVGRSNCGQVLVEIVIEGPLGMGLENMLMTHV